MILVTLCSLLCTSVSHVWSLSMDYIPLITAITLVAFITLCEESLNYNPLFFIIFFQNYKIKNNMAVVRQGIVFKYVNDLSFYLKYPSISLFS